MADNFTGDNFQGVFGEFKFVIDETLPLTDDNIQGVFGAFVPVADEAASGAVPASFDIFPQSTVSLFSRSFIPFLPGLQFMSWRNFVPVPVGAGRIMSSLAWSGGLAHHGGMAGKGGGLAS